MSVATGEAEEAAMQGQSIQFQLFTAQLSEQESVASAYTGFVEAMSKDIKSAGQQA